MNIVLLGAGNLATSLALRVKEVGLNIVQIYSRTVSSAVELSSVIGCEGVSSIDDIIEGADIYIVAISDRAHVEVLPKIKFNNSLVVHTSGSIDMETLSAYSNRYGVLYPLQTFTKGRLVDFSEIPICIEASDRDSFNSIERISNILSNDVRRVSSKQRRELHLSAVYVCNFVNYLYGVAEEFMSKSSQDFDILRPLIQETASKIMSISPKEAQTGPAVRFDTNIIDMHLNRLEGEKEQQEIYKILSEAIYNRYN